MRLEKFSFILILLPELYLCAVPQRINYTLPKLRPLYKPTKGEIWPAPQKEKKGDTIYSLDLNSFEIKVTEENCTLLWKAVQRYKKYLNDLKSLITESNNIILPEIIKTLEIRLLKTCEKYPYFEMDESYNLTVLKESKLTSNSVWGIMRGLESFLQLFYYVDDFTEIRTTKIIDYPSYAHRGFLIDTSRHFISMDNILLLLDALAMNKYNVLHVHFVDDPSFPFQSKTFPELSAKGAFNQSMVYTTTLIDEIIQYARERGIRVIPEFTVPGHGCSWHASHPEVVIQDKQGIYCAWNPIKDGTYSLLGAFFKEVAERFPDNSIHTGGDELPGHIWKTKEIEQYAEIYNISMKNNDELFALFMKRLIPQLGHKNLIVWQDVFDAHVPLPNTTMVQVWRNGWDKEMLTVLKAGYRVLYSSTWYLDQYLNYSFEYMYQSDPRSMVDVLIDDKQLLDNIVGGEAAMWTEQVDDKNLMSTAWPRASAVAEVLWGTSVKTKKLAKVPKRVYHRFEEHIRRMIRRGILTEPVKGFCLASKGNLILLLLCLTWLYPRSFTH